MRPIRRFGGTPTLISDRLGTSKSHDRINTLTRPSWSALDEDRRKLRSLFFTNNYTSVLNSEKENRSDDASSLSSTNGFRKDTTTSTSAASNGIQRDYSSSKLDHYNGSSSYSTSSIRDNAIDRYGSARSSARLPDSSTILSNRDAVLDTSTKTSSTSEPEIIMNTPSFQLVCARRVNHRHISADDVITNLTSPIIESATSPDEKLRKSAMKKSQSDYSSSSSNGYHLRPRWMSSSSAFKRSVSFADDKGYRLTEIRLIDCDVLDELPLNTSYSYGGRQASGFIADFILPPPYRRLRALQADSAFGSSTTSAPPVSSSQIVLESYSSSRWDVKGIIAVRANSDTLGHKRVFVRYTNDHWTSSTDSDATVTTDRSESNIEKYAFTLPFPLRPQTGSKLEFKFGVRMPAGVGGVLSPITYWDDNHGTNYCFTFV